MAQCVECGRKLKNKSTPCPCLLPCCDVCGRRTDWPRQPEQVRGQSNRLCRACNKIVGFFPAAVVLGTGTRKE